MRYNFQIFKGAAGSGCWMCFDEFNRVEIEVMSTAQQQVMHLLIGEEKNVSNRRFPYNI